MEETRGGLHSAVDINGRKRRRMKKILMYKIFDSKKQKQF